MAAGREDRPLCKKLAELYAGFVAPADLVFDIGANHGEWTEAFLSLGARVIAAEPQPHCISILQRRFEGNSEVTVLGAALGDSEGEGTLVVSNNDTVSSMSREWIERARASGRFDDSNWDGEVIVEITTLDRLIESFGIPAFIKIDVEGFEDRVLGGLSVPIKSLSFEYTPEHLKPALRSMDWLESLGKYSFNYSEGDSYTLALGRYVSKADIANELEALSWSKASPPSGDIYARWDE